MDIVFVILHYNAMQETLNLIASIKEKIDTSDFQIVVVDNCSPNGSGSVLASTYYEEDKVTVILNKENVGFANGNNIGIEYARTVLNAEYICCLNNDTLLNQSDFLYQIRKEYVNSNAAVIGPFANLKDGNVQISAYKLRDLDFYKQELYKYSNGVEEQQNVSKNWLKNRIPTIYGTLKAIKNNFIFPGLYFRKENRVLHGSCLIFTPMFFRFLDGFDKRTFLFREEELLYLLLQKHHLKSVYNPKIKIIHLEDVATDSIIQTSEEKKEFIRKNQIESLKVLISELSTSEKS